MTRRSACLLLTMLNWSGSVFTVHASESINVKELATVPVPILELKHDVSINSMAISSDGWTLASTVQKTKDADSVSVVRVWDLHDGKVTKSWDAGGEVISAIAFSPDGKTIAVGSAKAITLWSTEGKALNTWSGHTGNVARLEFSPDGKTLASASLKRLEDKPVSELFLWDIASGTKRELPVEVPERHSFVGVAPALSFSADGTQLIAPQSHFRVGIWDVRSGRLTTSIGDESVKGIIMAVALSPDGKVLATGHMGHELRLWSVPAGTLQSTLLRQKDGWDGMGASGEVIGLFFKPDGQTLVSAGTNQEGAGGEADLFIWNLPKLEITASLVPAPAEGIKRLAVSANTSTFATNESLSNTIKVWRTTL